MNDDVACSDHCPPEDTSVPVPGDGPELDAAIAAAAKALAHPARVQIMRVLLERSSCTCGEIVESLPLAQATVSQHLKVLKEAGLVRGEVEGARACYCASPHALHRLGEMLRSLDAVRV